MSAGPHADELMFGRFRIVPAQRQLLVDGEPARLGARAFDVLHALVERRERVVSKNELLELVWPGLVVEENNLQVHISTLRKVLGLQAIATIPGRGYRFTLSAPAADSPSPRPNNIPQQLSSFIGRINELTAIESLLARSRLLTLTGAGGCGKTRLGLRVATDSLDRFPDGAWFVELAALADPCLVPQTAAAALGVIEVPGKSIAQSLLEHLEQKRLLLVLDNCEHLLDACARFADTLLRRCPYLKIIATSREALAVAGEQSYRVPPLSLPDRTIAPTPEAVSGYESVQLFVDRALLVRHDFQVDQRNAPALASLCRHLDGMPLAIELAAARVRSFPVEEIDRNLDQRFQLLTGGLRTALPRHRTLRALIDWSYDLLDESQKLLLQRLSIFAGGASPAGVEAVCAGESVADADVIDLLTSLADRNLVVADQADAQVRYRLLETVRQYAREKLVDNGAETTVRERHIDYFVSLAEKAAPYLTGAEDTGWLRHLDEEHENLRAAIEGTLAQGESRRGLRLCGALIWFWAKRGYISESREWCRRVLDKPGNEQRTRERGKALLAAGHLALYQGDFAASGNAFAESVAIMRELGDRPGMGNALAGLGAVSRETGAFALAREQLAEALAIRREVGDVRAIGHSLMHLAAAAMDEGDSTTAAPLLAEGLSTAHAAGDRWNIATILYRLGLAALFRDDHAEARSMLEQSLAMRRE